MDHVTSSSSQIPHLASQPHGVHHQTTLVQFFFTCQVFPRKRTISPSCPSSSNGIPTFGQAIGPLLCYNRLTDIRGNNSSRRPFVCLYSLWNFQSYTKVSSKSNLSGLFPKITPFEKKKGWTHQLRSGIKHPRLKLRQLGVVC